MEIQKVFTINGCQVTLMDLYKAAKVHDSVILSRFNEEGLDDQTYLFLGINEDLVANTLSILINVFCANEDSIGIDASCRAIIEAFVVLKMKAEKKISDEQAKLYRNQFAITEYSALSKIVELGKDSPRYSKVEQQYDQAIGELAKYFNRSEEQVLEAIKRHRPSLDDPNTYLKTSWNQKINFSTLLEDNPIFDEEYSRAYEFFSLGAHPRYESDDKIEGFYHELRIAHINHVLTWIAEYFGAGKLYIEPDKTTDFAADFLANPALANIVRGMGQTDQAFERFEEALLKSKDFPKQFFRQTNSLAVDMMISLSLGYRESVLAKFKSFLEYAAVYKVIVECGTQDEQSVLELAYLWSSRAQLESHLSKVYPEYGDFGCRASWKELYKAYYKEKYKEKSFEEFFENICGNSFYFLRKKKRNFRAFVTPLLELLYLDKERRSLMKAAFGLANDIAHGGGYAFNASEELVNLLSLLAYQGLWRFLACEALSWMAIYSDSKDVPEDKTYYRFFQDMLDLQTANIQQAFDGIKKRMQ